MSEVINILKKIINKKTISSGLIEEKDISAKLKKIVIKNVSSNMLLLKPDDAKKIKCRDKVLIDSFSTLFSQAEGCLEHNKACDAVLINAPSPSTISIFYVDLKSGHASGCREQFISTRCFVKYLFHVVNDLSDIAIKDNYKEVFIILWSKPPMYKPVIRMDKKIKQNDLLEINGKIFKVHKIPVINEAEISCTTLFKCQ